MRDHEISAWLREEDPDRIRPLLSHADETRRAAVGDAVHLRGLVEISNHCRRSCLYCGLRAGRQHPLERYRMSAGEILACARTAQRLGYGTVVLQAGEDPGLDSAAIADLIRRIKTETGLALTLSLGERDPEELADWREAGADRYLLRFETSDADLYARIHPPRPGQSCDRFDLLRLLDMLGYEVGSGIMVGIPGQTYASLLADLREFGRLGLDMIGIGPYIPNPDADPDFAALASAPGPQDQVPPTPEMARKVVALTRILYPHTNIPSTTGLATVSGRAGYASGLMAGANVVMPNLTPTRYRELYAIYPHKICAREDPEAAHANVMTILRALGRAAGVGPGHSPRYRERHGIDVSHEDLCA